MNYYIDLFSFDDFIGPDEHGWYTLNIPGLPHFYVEIKEDRTILAHGVRRFFLGPPIKLTNTERTLALNLGFNVSLFSDLVNPHEILPSKDVYFFKDLPLKIDPESSEIFWQVRSVRPYEI